MEWPKNITEYPSYWHSRLRRGFGLGAGLGYQPWLRVRDVPSKGSSGNPKGITIPRTYHLLSKIERTYFHLLDRQADVVDIREQFPVLDVEGTLKLCSELGVRHPYEGRYPKAFTFDFLVTRQTASGLIYQARSLKTVEDSQNNNVRALLNVEYQWSKKANLDWQLVNVSGFTDDLQSTLSFMRSWYLHRYEPDPRIADQFAKEFRKHYRSNVPLKELIEVCSKKMRRSYFLTQNDFRYCAWSGRIRVKLNSRLTLHLPVTLEKQI